jgi:methionyl-tRNA synthetase
MARFYITTPIYYVNALPHLGTFYSTVVADALARYHRARGDDTFFLTGLDEHGQKIERIGRDRGVALQAYTDEIAGRFQEVWARVGISNDDFVRTTSARHKQAVAEMWRRMQHDIYQAEYEGLYCVGCEDFKTDAELSIEGDRKLCLIHKTPVEPVREKNYFFRLSKYQQPLLDYYREHPAFIQPESRRNEVVSFVSSGLRDISVSRSTVKWGIPVPGDPEHTVYVWIDALTNYLTVLGGPDAVAADGDGLPRLWPAAHHLIAKDILRFHAVYWPAMLMSAGLPQPRGVFCHGYLTVKGQKIAKSAPATRVDPVAIVEELGVDPLRYFVLREYTLGGDGDFTYEALFQRYESDLGNDLGNLLNRTVSMAHRYLGGEVPPTGTLGVGAEAAPHLEAAEAAWEAFSPSQALQATWNIVRRFNRFIDETKPWTMIKEDRAGTAAVGAILGQCCEALRWAALMVAPAMPTASREILRQLGRGADEGKWPSQWAWPGGKLAEPKPVFPRIEPDRQAALITKWVPAEATAPAATAAGAGAAKLDDKAEIGIEDFARLDLRVARVTAAERVPKADKLLKLTLDVGGEPRTVVSGVAPAYAPEQMVGRTVIYLANLKPAKIRGVLSQGMILAAGDAEVLALSALDRDVAPGTKIR